MRERRIFPQPNNRTDLHLALTNIRHFTHQQWNPEQKEIQNIISGKYLSWEMIKSLIDNPVSIENSPTAASMESTAIDKAMKILLQVDELFEHQRVKHNIIAFSYAYDFSLGAWKTLGTLNSAVKKRDTNMEEELTMEEVSEHERIMKKTGRIFSEAEILEIYLNHIGRSAKEGVILGKDPTGKYFLEWFLDELRNKSQRYVLPPICVREFVIAGAELARDAYKSMHPILS